MNGFRFVVHRSSFIVSLLVFLTVGGCRQRPALETIEAGGGGPPLLVLVHGYGSSAAEWMPFTQTIRLPANGRFIFPQAPATIGFSNGRAWWPLELAAHIPSGKSLPDLSSTSPPGLKASAARIRELLQDLRRPRGGPILLGGYSQGAMVASEVAFQSDEPLAALILLSGTPVDEASWQANYSRRRRLPVFMSHGRTDPVLPFDGSLRMKADLESAGVPVTWLEFAGGHEIPVEVVRALNDFLARLPLQ